MEWTRDLARLDDSAEIAFMYKEDAMSNRAKNALGLTAILMSFLVFSGCATTTEVNNANANANAALTAANKAEATANEALQKATEAEKTANEAKTSCEKCSRMFKKSLQK